MRDDGVPFGNVGPGATTSDTTAVKINGMINEMVTKRAVDTFSCSTKGKDISGSTGENGRWFGSCLLKASPTAAIPLGKVSELTMNLDEGISQDDDPVDSI